MELKYKVYNKTTDSTYFHEEISRIDTSAQMIKVANVWLDYEKEIEAVILPYTGVKDINKKESYLGDIVKFQRSTGVIIFKECCFEINWIENNDFFTERLYVFKGRFEIVGNIYENPEMIKKEG